MSVTTVIMHGLTNKGFQRIALNSTATSLNSTVRQARILDISVETANARYRMDGTSPTATTGVLLFASTTYRFEGFSGTSALKFCAGAAGSIINVQGYNV